MYIVLKKKLQKFHSNNFDSKYVTKITQICRSRGISNSQINLKQKGMLNDTQLFLNNKMSNLNFVSALNQFY